MPRFFIAATQPRPILTQLAGPNGTIVGNRKGQGQMHDVLRDWRSWSRIERAAVTVMAVVSLMIVLIGLT